jgi:hypothetical protein
MKIRTFGDFVKKWWFWYLFIFAKTFGRNIKTFTGNDFLDIIFLILIITGALYFGFKLSGGDKVTKHPF